MTELQQAIIIPIKNKREINKLRKKFDTNYKKFKAHLTLIYRFDKLGSKTLYRHIRESIKNTKSFEIVFRGYSKSTKEFYLYFDIRKNKSRIMKLHQRLKSGPLRKVNNPRMTRYVPHISLGFFKTKRQIEGVIGKLPKNLEIKERVDKVQLITIDKNRNIKQIKNFKLK